MCSDPGDSPWDHHPAFICYYMAMNEQETAYINRAKDVIAQQKNAVETLDMLAALEMPSKDKLNLNTLTLINAIGELEHEREDGELDGGISDDESYDDAELKIATNILNYVKRILSDIEQENWYKQVFSISFVYSWLKDDDYLYKITERPLDVTTYEEAEKQRDALKPTLLKALPEDPNYTLEDVRIGVELVDSKNKPVK